MNLDDPKSTIKAAGIIKSKRYLYELYKEYYKWFSQETANSKREIIELGSGGGFIKEIMPFVVTSDILNLPFIDKRFSALSMPFKSRSISAFVMINVLHHVKDGRKFFYEINRCLTSGGKFLAVEPANTLWARFIYQHFHHETFDPTSSWRTTGTGPVSDANGAIPWIILKRDRKKFETLFPRLKIISMRPHTPFRYLLSGGLTYPQFLPDWSYSLVSKIENFLSPLNPWLGMFYSIVIEKR